jgi:tetratricopeptide (TPR) repeat protein
VSGLQPQGPRDLTLLDELYLSHRARRRARTLLKAARWDETGALFETEADRVPEEVAAPIWLSAIHAYRRADRPAAALRCLVRLQEITPKDAPHAATVHVEQAAVFCDLGELGRAVESSLVAVEVAPSREVEAVALDLQVSALLLGGNLSEAEKAVGHMRRVASRLGPAAQVASQFRTGQILRLYGDFDGASKAMAKAQSAVPVIDETAGSHGQIEWALAELAFVQDDLDETDAHLLEAEAAFQVAGQRQGLFRTEALRLDTALERGVPVVARSLDTAVDYARDRQLALLEAELRITRGKTRTKGGPDFARAIELAETAGAVVLEGRARFARRTWGEAHDDLERTRWCLESDRVLLARVMGGDR